jgi:hypothetical protein
VRLGVNAAWGLRSLITLVTDRGASIDRERPAHFDVHPRHDTHTHCSCFLHPHQRPVQQNVYTKPANYFKRRTRLQPRKISFGHASAIGSVEGGERIVSTAGVLGGRESSMISAVGTGSGMGISGRSGVVLRVIFNRGRLRVFDAGFSGFSGFSGLSWFEERCFFGDKIGSVLTGSIKSDIDPILLCVYLLAERTGSRSNDEGLDSLLGVSIPGAPEILRRLNLKASPLAWLTSSSSWTLNFRFAPVRRGFVAVSSASSGDSKRDTRRMLSFGPLSRRFLRVSRFTDNAGSPSSPASSRCSSTAGLGSKPMGSSSSNRATGGGPMSGDWLSGSSKTC